MNEQTFSMGEIAVIAFSNTPDWPVGREVEILSPLKPCNCSFFCTEMVYTIGYVGDREVIAPPYCLRKRRPPQDWKTLCKLTDLPRELEPA